MAIAHRQTGTTKSNRHKIVIPNIESAWAAFEESLKFETMEDYRSQGWRSAEDFPTTHGITREAIVHRLNKDKSLESKTVKVFHMGGVRKKRIYRPKSASLARK